MDERLVNEGLSIAPGVVETIVSLAAGQVDGVAQVTAPGLSRGLLTVLGRRHPGQGVVIMADEDGIITVAVRVRVYYGYRLQEVAEQIRHAVAGTLLGQIGIEVAAVDVFIDGIQFPE
jgi:uncharacterized alkaline shock family protein YloU